MSIESREITTAKPVVSGVINIIVGSLCLLGALILGFGILLFMPVDASSNFGFLVFFIAVPLIALGVTSFIGGVHNLRRESWTWALAGSITTTVLTLVGAVSIVLTAISKDEFAR